MSSIQIPNLPAATGLSGSEQFEGVQSGTSVRIAASQIAAYINAAYPAPGISSVTGTAPIAASTVSGAVTISLNPQGVTNSFLAPMAAGTVKANVTVGSASPTDPTVSQVLDVIGSTKGNLLYRDTTSWAALTGGSSGQVLTANGSTAVPTWETLSVPSGQIAPTGVVAGTYGSASTVPQYTVLASGQLSAASNVPIVIPYTSVTGLGSMATQNASAVAITGGTIDGTTIGGVTPAPATFTTLTSTGATNLGTIASGVWNGTAIGVSYGGTGATTASGARSNLGAAASGANSDITSLSGLTTPLSSPQGGTGFSSYTTGDLLYADTSSTLARLNDIATGNALLSGGIGVAPSWGKIGLTTHVSGTLPVANGGSGATTLTGFLKGNGTSAFTAQATIGNSDLTNSSVTIGSTSISLGGTATTLGGLTTVTLTQDPTAALEAATKQYVDNEVLAVSNTTFHTQSGYATTADLGSVTYSNGTGGVGATITQSGSPSVLVIDGYTFTASDVTNATRVLVKDQTSGLQNGIYTVTNEGSGAANWQLTRATDFNTVGTGPNYIETGASTFVTGGALYGSTGWVMNTTGTIIVGTTALVWVQSSSSASVTVTSPLQKVGSVISLNTVPTTLGGTGLTTLTQYNVMLGNGTGNVAFAAPSTTGYPLLSTGASSNPAFGQLSLTAGVTGTLPVANGGTGTSTAFTTGSVVFAGASGTYTQNATELFWDNTNTFLGIGTNTPRAELTVVADTQTFVPATASLPAGTEIYVVGADSANTRITQDAFGTGNYVAFTGRQARGTAASPTATQANDPISLFTGRGYGATAWSSNSVGYLGIYAAENFTDTAQGSYIDLETTNLGSASVTRKFRVGSEGQWGIHSGGTPNYGTSGYVFTSAGASSPPTWSQVSASSLSGVLPVANGGTNISSYTIGDLIYASGATTLSKLADVATGNALISGGVGVAPSWGKIGLTTHVSGTLPIANGGTGLASTPTDGQLLIGSTSGGGYALGTLTASTGISVTNGAGSITIANTGVTSLTAGTNISVSASTGGVTISTTTTPTWTSEVVPLISGGTTASSTLTLQSTTGAGTSDAIIFKTASQVEAMRINTSGNVGIGTSSITAGFRLQAVNSGGSNVIASTSSDASGVTTYLQANGSTSGVFGTLTNHPQVFVTNNTERMRIDSSGNLLVGNTTGVAKLTVQSASASPTSVSIGSRFCESTSNYGVSIGGASAGYGWIQGLQGLSSTTGYNDLSLQPNGGNVGIGTTTTSNGRLSVLGTGGATANSLFITNIDGTYNPYIQFQHSSAGVKLYASSSYGGSASSLTFASGGVDAMTITGSNVGIGTTSGSSFGVFSVNTTTSANTPVVAITANSLSPQLNHYITDSGSTIRNLNQIAFNTGSSSSANYQGFMTFSTMGSAGGTISERMRIDSSGIVAIGGATNTWYSNRRALQIYGNSVATLNYAGAVGESVYNFYWNAAGNGIYQNTAPAAYSDFNNTVSGGFGWRIAASGSAGATVSFTTVLQLDASGNLTAAGNVTAYSDARLKKNVSTIDKALDLVEKMRGVRYERIDSGKAGVGVIAQEMQEVLPEVVHEGENLSVAYGNIVGVLIEAVKELSARVKELEAK